MKIKQPILLLIVLLALGFVSIIIHELVHVMQGYLMFGVTGIEIHFFWEGDYLHCPWYYFPLAWTVIPGVKGNLYLELMAYFIQFTFMTVIYVKFIYKNPRFKW